MDCKEEQEEEIEVLRSIYEVDERFKEIDERTFQYKFGEDGHFKSFVLEISWHDSYPESAPNINLDAFYNKHISVGVKESIIAQVLEQCEACMGGAMTFTLFDWTNENAEDLMAEQQEGIVSQEPVTDDKTEVDEEDSQPSAKKEKKEILTKNQKRKLGNRLNAKGELERGWNWVDIVKHLSKTAST